MSAIDVEHPSSGRSGRTERGPNPRAVAAHATAPVRWLRAVSLAHPRRTLTVLAAGVAVLALLSGGLWVLTRAHEANLAAQERAMEFARDRVVALLSYDYRTIDAQVADNADVLTGGFKDEYAALVTDVIAPAAKERQVTTQTEVVAQSIVSGDTEQVMLLMFLNQQSQDSSGQEPFMTGSRVRVVLEHQGDGWMISELTPV